MFDLLKDTIKFHIKRRVERGRGSWGFIFPAILVLVLVLWTLRITVITMEYQTTSGAEQSATETDGEVADVDGLDGETVMLAAETDAMSETNSQTENSIGGAVLAAAASEDDTTEAGSDVTEESSSESSDTGNTSLESGSESSDTGNISLQSSASTEEATLTNSYGETLSYTASDVTYNDTTGGFDVSLRVNFEFNANGSEYYISTYDTTIVTDTDYTIPYRIQLPENVIVPSSLIRDGAHNGYLATDTQTIVFKYYFDTEEVNGETVYYIYLVFKDESTLSGYVEYSGSFSSEAYETSSESIRIYDSTTQTLLIEVKDEDITYSGNTTMSEDISVVKSGSYDSSTNTVTYTITVFSEKGTGDTIDLTDFMDSGFADILGELTGVSLSTTTVTYTTYNGENYGVTAGTTTSPTDLQTRDSSSAAPYYYTDEDGTLHIVLEALGEYTGGDSYGSTTKTANAYVITYTYSVDPDAQVTYTSTNSVTATTEYDTNGKTISDTAAATVYATGATVLSKNGSYNSTEGTVTWTLTVGDGTSSLKDYVLRDEMLGSLAADDIAVKDASGNTLSEDDICYAAAETDANGTVTYTYYSDASMTTEVEDISNYALIYVLDTNAVSAILFNSNTGAQYTITYTTSAGGSWTTQSVSNTATLDYEGSDEGKEGKSYTSNYSMYVTGSGVNAFTKTLNSDSVTERTDSNGDTVLTLSWTSTFTVPSTGIPAGTVFTDYATSQSGSGLHHITYEQAKAIIDALNNAWGSENISIEFCTNSNAWSTSASDWVSSAALDTSGGTKYYQFRFTLLNDIAQDTNAASGSVKSATDDDGGTTYSASTVTYTYSTTAETTGYDTNIYYNTLTDGSNSKSASYTWYDKVAKYGTDAYGNISTGDSSITTSVDDDGNVTVAWVVRLVVESGTTYTVTDTLPEGVELTALQVSKSGNYSYSDIAITDSDAQGNSGISTTVDGVGTFAYTEDTWSATNTEGVTSTGQKTVLNISGVDSGVSMLYLKYTCTYEADTEAAGNSYALTNHVSVATGSGEDYGDASQTTTVTIPETTTTTSDLTKTSVFDGTNNVLIYTVDINPDGKTYTDSSGEAYGDLTVTDTLSYSTYPGMGMMRSATLITSSLKLTDADTGEELDLSEYSWTYSESSTLIEWALATYGEAYQEVRTITLTIPNSRHLKLTYEYSFTIIQDGNWTEYNTNATNKATLSAESETIYETPSLTDASTLSEVLTYGAANSGSVGYTIYKVDADNFSTKLSGAIFTLYVYDATSRNFIAAGNFTTGSSGSVTILGTPNFGSNGKLASYSVEVSGQEPVTIPLNTMCFIVETTAPEDYQLDDTKYYFYYGESVSSSASDCDGYSSAASDAKNMVLSWSNYITNEHSSDYYAAKTSISVLKKWFDSNGEEYEKADGSITFELYRVLRLTDGTITSAAEADSGSSSGSSGSAGSSGSYLTWQLRYNNYNTGYVTYAEGKTEITAGQKNTVYFSVYYTGNNEWWYTPLTLYLVTDDGTETLATAGGSWTWSSNIENSGIVEEVSYSDQTYTFTLNVTDPIEIRCDASDVYPYSLNTYVLSATAATETTDSGGTADEPDSGSSSGTEATGAVYRLNFSDLANDDDFTVDQTTGADKAINGKYGWLSDDTPVSPDGSAGFFTVYGNLSISHGTASWDVDGNGIVDTDEGENALKVCLKMESGAGTTISFTSEEGGYLTMVFNSQGNGNSVKLTDENSKVSVLTPKNTVVSIYQYLEAGTYTITYNKTCYLFYMDFEEGAVKAEEDGNAYIHDFDDGLTSSFYAISGSLSYNYGTVSYDDIIASQCLKMSSSASITFTSTEAGTIYLILTNPKGASKVGVTLDGEEVYATSTQSADTQGYRIYTIMQRVEAGTHTIKRINGTEVMLYYIAYMADDYGGNVWGTDDKTSALGNLTTEEQEAYERYKELVDTITISASTDWAWYSSKLASEYVDTETGVVKGEYLYYLVETKVNAETDYSNNYKVTYLNDDGIEYGSIGISNTIQKNTDEDTEITIAKRWVDATGTDESGTYGASGASISYSLYSMMNLYKTATAEDLTSGDSITRSFSTKESDSFYEVGTEASLNTNSDVGDVVYEGVTYSYRAALKMNSKGTVKFDTPATNGTLTLVFSALCKEDGSKSDISQYGPAFKITNSSGDAYSYVYDYGTSTFSVYYGGNSVSNDPYNAVCTYYSADNNAVVVQLSLSKAETYTIGRYTSSVSPECYLFYIEYAYQYCYLVDGILTQEGTITPDTGSSWSKTIASLPKYIYNDAGDKKIGEYSYYVKETGVTIMIDGEAKELTPDSSGDYYSYSYTDGEGTMHTYTVRSAVSLPNGTTASGAADIAENTITEGTLSIVNTVSVSSVSQQEQDEYVLPATGGTGTIPGYAAGILLLIASAIIVFRRNRWQGCE